VAVGMLSEKVKVYGIRISKVKNLKINDLVASEIIPFME